MHVQPVGTIVMLNSSGCTLLRKLTQHGGNGLVFTADGARLSDAEARGRVLGAW